MSANRRWISIAWLLGALAVPGRAVAQDVMTSIGLEGAALGLRVFHEGPVGCGVRIAVGKAGGALAADASLLAFPENPSGNFGERLWLAGVRVRVPIDRARVFVKARAGQIYFNGSYFDGRLSDRSHTALDAGFILERRLGDSLLVRLDVGTLIIPFGDAAYLAQGLAPVRLGTTRNPMAAVGLAWKIR